MIYLPCTHTHTLSSTSLHLRIHKKKKTLLKKGSKLGKVLIHHKTTSTINLENLTNLMIVVWSEPNMHAIPWTIPLM